ncbi:MAG TPA: hypothetical protein PK228_18950, partial [Saprospiraceae bacterium]|nr:hypothetical protein [Saprospiraceae bacterium]
MEVVHTDNFQPDVSFWGLRIGEPVVALTSVLVALFCFYAWYRLGKISRPGDALRLFRIFFLLMGTSTLTGGIVGHALMHQFSQVYKAPGWMLGMIGVSAFEQVSIVRARSFLKAGWVQALKWLNIVELMLAMTFVFVTLWFPAVEMHSAFGMLLVVVPLEGRMFFLSRSAVSRYILLGISLLVAGVIVHILKISAG